MNTVTTLFNIDGGKVVAVHRDAKGQVIWTRELDRFIAKSIKAKMSYSKIGDMIGLSKNTVLGRAWRVKLGLTNKVLRDAEVKDPG